VPSGEISGLEADGIGRTSNTTIVSGCPGGVGASKEGELAPTRKIAIERSEVRIDCEVNIE
jgi:hypothetical protein